MNAKRITITILVFIMSSTISSCRSEQMLSPTLAPTATLAPTDTELPTQKPTTTQAPSATPAPTATQIPTQKPTDTPIPTPTSIPTETPTLIPTETPIPPSPTITPSIEPPLPALQLLIEPTIVTVDKFVNADLWHTFNDKPGDIVSIGNPSESMGQIIGQKDFQSALVLDEKLKEGDAVVIHYQFSSKNDFQAQFALTSGVWATNDFRMFGIYNGKSPKANLWRGSNALGFNNLIGNLLLRPNQWYGILLAIGQNGEFAAAIWDKEAPSMSSVYRERLGEKWMNLEWSFVIQVNEGESLLVDDFYKIVFSELRK